MLFPIGDDQVKGGAFPVLSYAFIFLNIGVFFLLQYPSQTFTSAYSVVPYEIINGIDLVGTQNGIPHAQGPKPIYLTLLTAMFMHGSLMHLIGNMVFLWIFADNIESTIGRKRFLLFYLTGGVFASFSHILADSNSVIPSLGASGAIAACLGAYLVMFPQSRIKMLFIIKIFSVPAFLFLGFWIIQQLFNGYGSLSAATGNGGVAWFAHIGGFFFGVISGLYFRFIYPKMHHIDHEYAPVKRKAYRYNNREITGRF